MAATVLAGSMLLAGTIGAAELPAKPPSPSSAPAQAPSPPSDNRLEETGRRAGEIVTQPARDVGVAKTDIPPVLAKAVLAPYALQDLKSCKQLSAAVIELNQVLGPDFIAGREEKENRAGKLAEAGGKTVVNALIPFRGLVREITGAAPAQRRLNAAIDAGFARRGFLRGIHLQRGCRTGFDAPAKQQEEKKSKNR